MAMTGTSISVSDEVGVLRDVLVQGPVCRPLGGSVRTVESSAPCAEQQHGRLVRHLEAQGVMVRHFDALLYSALGFPDARDWILENRAGAPSFKATRRREREHGVEKVGRELRRLMTWIDEKEVD